MKPSRAFQTAALVALVIAPLSGAAFATETQNHEYVAFGAPQVLPATTVCPLDEDHDDEDHLGHTAGLGAGERAGGEEAHLCLGGYEVHAEDGTWTQYTATIADDWFEAPYLNVCVVPEDGHDDHAGDLHVFCGDADGEALFFAGCGVVVIPTSEGITFDAHTAVQGLIATVQLDTDTLEPCFGSAGDVVSVFS